jgi:hypothetical protein
MSSVFFRGTGRASQASLPAVTTVDLWRRSLFDQIPAAIRLESSAVVLPKCRAPWSFCVQRDRVVFHIVVQGTYWLDVKGTATLVQLSEGDFVVV